MNNSGKLPDFPALPSTIPLLDEARSTDERSNPSSSQDGTTRLPTPPWGMNGVRESSRQRWESLKPLIKRVYMDENKPFPYLADILRTQHSFEPTKRQFSRKIVEWGFRKNVSRLERDNILHTLPHPNQNHEHNLHAKDPRLKPQKLRNWRKRYRAEVNGRTHLTPPMPACQASRDTSASFTTPEWQTFQTPDSQGIPSNPTSDSTADGSSGQTPESCGTAVEGPSNKLWMDDWASVDVPHSPGLSRLFVALEIECSNPVPPLSLDSVSPQDQPCISEIEIQDLFNDDNKVLACNLDLNMCFPQPKHLVSQREISANSLHSSIQRSAAVFLGYIASPLNELYAFPPPPPTQSSEVLASRRNVWKSLATQEMELETKLAKLTPLFGESHPSVLAVMEDLSRLYYDRRKYKEAEVVDCQLVDLYLQTLTTGDAELRALDAYQRVVDALVAQGQYHPAQRMNRGLLSAFVKISHLGTARIAHAISMDALIAEELGYTEEAESLHRQVLQIWLSYCGPRDSRTLNSMTQLGYILALTHGPGDERLLRYAVQIHLEGSVAADEEACRSMTNLSAAFWAQGNHEEGCDLAKAALDKFLPSLGNEHPDILAAKVASARNMTNGGKLAESENLFREVVSVESTLRGSAKPVGLCNSSYGLARVLTMRGCYDEATTWYMEVFQARVSAYGWDHRYTLRVCYDLGRCYEMNRRYGDAILFYRQVGRRLTKIGSDGNSYHPDIDDLESCIRELEAQRSKNELQSSGLSDGAVADDN